MTKKKILFIMLPFFVRHGGIEKSCPTLPYGILSIASFINDLAEIRVFDCNLHDDYDKALREELIEFSPDIIGINMMYDRCFLFLESVVNITKEYNKDVTVLLGGAATTYTYKDIRINGIDAICYRDGEIPMRHFLETGKLNCSSWVTPLGNINPKKHMVGDLDRVIDVDYSLIDIQNYQGEMIAENFSPFIRDGDRIQLACLGSRGCLFSCAFCANSGDFDKVIRYASVDSIIKHIEFLIREYRLTVFSFYDEQLLSNKQRAKELFKRLKPYGLTLRVPGGVTPLYIDEELIDLMWNAGLDTITLALESGSKEVLKIMRKPVNLDQVRKVMGWLRKYNFFIRTNLVIGMPGETDVHRKETLDFIREIKPDLVALSIASPVLGSKLRQECINKGYIKDVKLGTYVRHKSVINTEEYSAEYVQEQLMNIMWQINFVENYRMSIGDYETAKRYFEYVTKEYPHEAFAWFYLNKAKEALGEEQDWTRFYMCLRNDPEWMGRFHRFGVTI
jgi:radical SAM superfamily enzyme YgiQ (UPF0313 family)